MDSPAPRSRKVLFAALAAYILLGPFVRQVLGVESPFLPRWRMFHTLGRDLWDARYFAPTGKEIEPPGLGVFVRNADDAVALGKRLCPRAGGGPVTLTLRAPSQYGWGAPETREIPCAP